MSRKTRKLIWSAPLVAVLAVAGALALFVALGANAAQAHDLPGAVANLSAEADGTTQIDLIWDAPTEGGTPTGYRIDRSMEGNTWMSLAMDHTSRNYSDMGLDPNTDYYYRVFAVNSAGTGPVSQDFQIQTDAVEPPDQVISLRATAMGQKQVNLTWSAPSDDGGAPITKYSIHWASDAVGIPAQAVVAGEPVTDGGVIDVDVADGTSYEHKKRMHTTRYKYIVYAWNGTGTGAQKATAESDLAAVTTAPLVKPGAPTGVTAVQTDARTFSLYWFAPSNDGGMPPVDYQVQAQYNNRGLYVTVEGVWRENVGVAADSSHLVPLALGTGDAAVDINIVRYQVYAITRADTTPNDGINQELKSSASSPSASMTIRSNEFREENIPAAPTFIADNAVRTPKGNVDLEWTAPAIDSDDNDPTNNNAPDSIGGYRIDVSDGGLHWRRLINHTRKTAAEYQYVDPENINRQYRIFAWHAQYLGPSHTNSVPSSLLTDAVMAPGHVTSFTATAVSPAQIDLSWTAPSNDGDADIVRYRIDAVRAGDGGVFAALVDPTSPAGTLPTSSSADAVLVAVTKMTSYMHKKLNAGETWKYRVLAINDSEEDAAADRYNTAAAASAETRTATTPRAELPEAPEGLVAEDAKDSSGTGTSDRGVLLQWNAPNPPDGAEITGYRIQRKKGDAAWETLENDTASLYTDYTDTSEPEAGELRQYRVAALNGSKLGAYSEVAYYPHALTMHNTAPMTVGMIAPVTVTAGQMSDAMDVSGYFSDADMDTLTYSAASSDDMVATASVNDGSMVTITGVAAGMATITVTATDAAGAYAYARPSR